MMLSFSAKRILFYGSAAVALGASGSVWAAEAEKSDVKEPKALDELVITGSRIASTTFETPTPITTISEKELHLKAASTVVEILRELPTLKPQINSRIGQGLGFAGADIRGLGPPRTLVLIDGRRALDSNFQGAFPGFDTSVLPAQLIKRVEVVTGGASAVYGSDAVAGVVNFFLDSNLEGGKLNVQYGVSQYNDYKNYTASGAWGTSFAQGRGHLVVAASYFNRPDPIYQFQRPWGDDGRILFQNPAYNPNDPNTGFRLIFGNDARLSRRTYGGLITTPGPLLNTNFGPNGTTSTFRLGTLVGGVYMQGGDGPATPQELGIIVNSQERYNSFTRVTYEITPNFEAWGEFLYGRATTAGGNIFPQDSALVIRRENPYIPQNIRAIMVANNIPSFTLGKIYHEFGRGSGYNKNDYWRAAIGLRGKVFGDWKWDLNATQSRSIMYLPSPDTRITTRFLAAVDVVTGPTGAPVCRETLTNPASTCIPVNVLGPETITPTQKASFTATGADKIFGDGVDFAANLTGELGATWAGPISWATGAEYRRESMNYTIRNLNGNAQPYRGGQTVKEAYLEAAVPLFKDQPFAENVQLDLAGRVVDYRTSGTTEVWKAGLNWRVNQQVRLRGTYSRDFAAPKLSALFQGANLTGGGAVTDPRNNTAVVASVISTGNRDLQPEVAHNLSAGVVLRPEAVPGLQISVDYYKITINNAIFRLSFQGVVDQCFKGDAKLCDLLIFNPTTGAIQTIVFTFFNAQQALTEGIDYTVNYTRPLGDGQLTLGVVAAYLKHLRTSIGGLGQQEFAGQLQSAFGIPSQPRWRATLSAAYDQGPFSARLVGNYVGKGKYDNSYGPRDISKNDFPHYLFLDLDMSYRLTDQFQVYGKIENLTNTYPPLISDNVDIRGQTATSHFHDTIGRAFSFGARYNW